MDNPALEPRHNWRVLLQLRAIAIMGQAVCVLVIFLYFGLYLQWVENKE